MMDLITVDRRNFSQAGDVLFRAFRDYPLMTYAIPQPGRRDRSARCLYRGILRDTLRHGEAAMTSDGSGVACWLPPATPPMTFLRSLRAGLGPLLVHAGWTGIRRLTAYDELQVTLHHRFASQPHWFLAAIGVMPDRQGQGLGRRLIEPTLARADAHQVPCYLETQAEKNVAIYQRLGFRVCWTGTPKGHPVAVWAMRRDPSGTEQTFGSHASSD